MNSVGTVGQQKLGVITQLDKVNNTVSAPLVLDVNRYFKPVWKPGDLLDNNLKSCGTAADCADLLASKASQSIHE